MSMKVRFHQRAGVSYYPSSTNESTVVEEIMRHPMPPPHCEDNFNIDTYTAASIGDNTTLKELLTRRPIYCNSKNKNGWNCLLYAAYLGHLSTCESLIQAGAKIDDSNEKGQTALMLASACGNGPVVQLLLQKGASVDRADYMLRQALHYAASCNQNKVVDKLLAAGADPNARDKSLMTPVLEACASGHELTLTCLLSKGGDITMKNENGEDGFALCPDSHRIQQLMKEHGGYVVEPNSGSGPHSMDELLDGMNLSRFKQQFHDQKIDLNCFLTLKESDFDEMTIAYGPKKRMLTVIEKYRKTGIICADTIDLTPVYHDYQQIGQIKKENSNDILIQGTLRYTRDISNRIKELSVEGLDTLRTNPNTDRLRIQLTSIMEHADQIIARLARHQL